jgi:hypothetical protein
MTKLFETKGEFAAFIFCVVVLDTIGFIAYRCL